MAVTRAGLTGAMTAYGAFTAKEEAASLAVTPDWMIACASDDMRVLVAADDMTVVVPADDPQGVM